MALHAGEIWLLWDDAAQLGMDAHVIALADALRVQGIYVRILCLGKATLLLQAQAVSRGIALTCIAADALALRRTAAAGRPRLMHTHGARAGIVGRLVGLLLDIPVVSTLESERDDRRPAGVVALVDRLSRRLSRGLIAVHEPFGSQPPNRARLISPFVDLGRRPAWLPRVVAQIARPDRGQCLESFCRLSAMLPPMEFALYCTETEQTLHGTEQAQVRLVDVYGSPVIPWAEIGLLCLTTGDATDYAHALQAMAHGVPVIAFALGPMQRLVADGENGWLVRSGNLAAMAHRISFWEAQGDDARRLVSDQARRAIAERFSPQTALAEVLGVYASAGA